MAFSLLTVLVNPNAFFTRDPPEWEALRIPALIVLAAALLAAATAYLTTDLIASMMPRDVQQYRGIMAIAGTVMAPLMTLVFWAIWSGAFYVVSLIFQGKGSFRRTLAATGYGHLPIAIGGVVSLAILWAFGPGIRVTPVESMVEIQAAVPALMHQPVLMLSSVLGIIFLLWSANIWVFGIRYARVLTLRNAAITVGVPVALYLLSVVSNPGVFR